MDNALIEMYEVNGGEGGEVFCSDSCAETFLEECGNQDPIDYNIGMVTDEEYIEELRYAGVIRCENCNVLMFGEEDE